MVALYVASSKNGSGKTTFCAGLAQSLLNDGYKVGFFKPAVTNGKSPESGDTDAAFMKHLLALDESVDIICPVVGHDVRQKVKEAYRGVAGNKDVVIIESASESESDSLGIVEALDARVLVMEDPTIDLSAKLPYYRRFGQKLLGIVLNKVPKSRVDSLRSQVERLLGNGNIRLLGVVPEDRVLFAMTIAELTERIGGEFLRGKEKSGELVENIMLGARTVDHGPDYFSRKANKAVLLRTERPDMQMAALQTATQCLVLTGNSKPLPVVMTLADEKDVPVVITKEDTVTAAARIEEALGKTRFNQEKKVPRIKELLKQYVDLQGLYKGLGIISTKSK